ncbi:MAG TPA: tRNA-dihydrouridine synthase, partial [candidate division Zixibacteria bacterium]|nr:tRNA-dihydrouridine synthase [candidate division Zixibacteria bacterium]
MKTIAKSGFWGNLKKPIYAMAPMADVTDAAYRYIIAKYGKPDVQFTEFTSADGLCSAGKDNLMKYLLYDEIERPIVVQLFGNNPENFSKAAELAKELGFDGIDINMGCPVKDVVKTGSGAALINNPELAKEIINSTKAGAGGLPVSVKTRIGFNSIAVEEWMNHLLEAEPAAITLHLRTKKEMSLVEAHWETLDSAVNLAKKTDTLILANGDLKDLDHADEMIAKTGVDGVMMARAIYGYPWLFERTRTKENITVEERLSIMIEHSILYEKVFEKKKNFAVMIKHLRAYASGFDGAKELRVMMEHVASSDDVKTKIA